MLLIKQLSDIKKQLKTNGYENDTNQLFIYRIGFKQGYRLAKQHHEEKVKRQAYNFKEKLVKVKDKKNNHHPKLSDVSKLINLVVGKTDITRTEIFSPCRTRAVSSARSLCFVLLRELMNISLPRIGELMGGKDHTTVIHHLRNKFYKRQLWTEGFRIWEEYEEIKEEFQK